MLLPPMAARGDEQPLRKTHALVRQESEAEPHTSGVNDERAPRHCAGAPILPHPLSPRRAPA